MYLDLIHAILSHSDDKPQPTSVGAVFFNYYFILFFFFLSFSKKKTGVSISDEGYLLDNLLYLAKYILIGREREKKVDDVNRLFTGQSKTSLTTLFWNKHQTFHHY